MLKFLEVNVDCWVFGSREEEDFGRLVLGLGFFLGLDWEEENTSDDFWADIMVLMEMGNVCSFPICFCFVFVLADWKAFVLP